MNVDPATPHPPESSSPLRWMLIGLLLVVVTASLVRYGTDLLNRDSVRDEILMIVPIHDILNHGWSRATMLDYQEVKGPTFYWAYAAYGEVAGRTMNAMRLMSSACFVLGAIPLLLLAHHCGIRRWGLLATAGFWCLLPYNAFLGQLLFSEPTFNALGLWALWSFVWGSGDDQHDGHPVAGPILCCLLMSLLLHHRPHAVALAGAIALVALERDRLQCWRWWLALSLAGASRLPLWMYWGGLVTSDYQGLFGFGLRLEGLVYLLAALSPMVWVLLLPAARSSQGRWIIAGAGLFGAALGSLVMPDLTASVVYTLPGRSEPVEQIEFAGIIATSLRMFSSSGTGHTILFAMLTAAGTASLAALGLIAFRRNVNESGAMVDRLAFWVLAGGLPLYMVTSGPVYDRYLAVWITLLPLVWLRSAPRWLLIVHALLLTGLMGYSVNRWMM